MKKYTRIMIMGRPGSGKSIFALKLQKQLKIPLYHLDKYFYVENWTPRDYEEFLDIQKSFVDSNNWIIDGNSTKSYEMRYAKATICIYFNFPRYLCYYRVFKRLFDKHPDIDDRALRCHETVRLSLLKYMWNFDERVSSSLKILQKKYPDVLFIKVCNNKDVNKLLEYFL